MQNESQQEPTEAPQRLSNSPNLPEELSKDAFLAWCREPMTQQFMTMIAQRREGLKESWAKRQFSSENEAIEARGAADVLGEVLEISFEELFR